MTHHHLGFQLLDRIQRDANDNDHRGAAQRQAVHTSHIAVNNGDQGHKRKEQSPDQRNFGKDLRDEFRRGLAGADARDGAVALATYRNRRTSG